METSNIARSILRRLDAARPSQPFATREDLAVLGAAIVEELLNHQPAKYVTVTDLMRTFGVGRDKIINALQKCNIPAVKMGSRILYERNTALTELKNRFAV